MPELALMTPHWPLRLEGPGIQVTGHEGERAASVLFSLVSAASYLLQ